MTSNGSVSAMSLKAYQNTQRIAEDPRTTEYRLFGQITGALIDAQQKGASGGPLAETLDWNRKLWRTLASDCMDDRNQLTRELRAQINSESLCVNKYSKQVSRNCASIETLNEINRKIMQ